MWFSCIREFWLVANFSAKRGGKLQVMRSYHAGLKIVTFAEEDIDYKAKVEIFTINFYSFKRNISSIKTNLTTNSAEAPNMILCCQKITCFLFFFIILDVSSFGKIIRTHAPTRTGCKWRHIRIHELMRMAEAMRREDKHWIKQKLNKCKQKSTTNLWDIVN